MDFPNTDPRNVTEWHAHIYYDKALTRDVAARLRERIARDFPDLRIGGWHDESVGPHIASMYQVVFSSARYGAFVPWLQLNRDGLSILVHPIAADAWTDHVVYGAWLGDKLPLNEPVLKCNRA